MRMKIIILLVVLMVGVSITCLVTVSEKNSIGIAAPIISISQQLNNATNWKKWNADLKHASESGFLNYKVTNDYQHHSFTISSARQFIKVTSPTGGRFEIIINKDGNASSYCVTLAAGKNIKSATVIIERKISLFSRLFSRAKDSSGGAELISHLKLFLETDSLYYGFSIGIQPVVDSNIVVYKKQVIAAERFSVLPEMYKVLQNFIAVNQLMVLQPPMLLFSTLPKDSVTVVAMLAVNRLVPQNDIVRCMKMPIKGRMLVGKFKGKYKDSIQLQIAMQQYCLDKNIVSIVNSYDKFVDNKVPENDDAVVEMEIHFPVL